MLFITAFEHKKSHDTSHRIVGIKQEKEGGKRQKTERSLQNNKLQLQNESLGETKIGHLTQPYT